MKVSKTEKTHSQDGSLTVSEMARREAEWRDQQPMTTRCAVDGCGWTFIGLAGDCRDAAAAHRLEAHPELANGKRRSAKNRVEAEVIAAQARRAKREEDERLAKIERGRQRDAIAAMDAGRPQPVLEETSAVADLSDSGSAVRPRGEPERADASSSTAHPYGLKKFGRGYIWTRDAALQAIGDFHAREARAPAIADSADLPAGTLPSMKSATQLFGSWDAMLAAAGLKRESYYRPGKRQWSAKRRSAVKKRGPKATVRGIPTGEHGLSAAPKGEQPPRSSTAARSSSGSAKLIRALIERQRAFLNELEAALADEFEAAA